MGSLTLGPEAVVRGDVTVIGGTLNRSPTARIEGSINNVALGERGSWRFGNFGDAVRDAFVSRVGGFAGTLLRVAFLLLLSLVVVAFGPGAVERIAERTATDPLRAGLIGFFAELLFLPLLVVTVVRAGDLDHRHPAARARALRDPAALVVLLVGFTGVAYQVGRALHGRFGWSGRGAYASVALGSRSSSAG